jgi:hypothetical protein
VGNRAVLIATQRIEKRVARMPIARATKLITLSLVVLLVASGCGVASSVQDRVSDYVGDSARDRLAERSKETLARLEGVRDIDVVLSDTVTLRQLQNAGIAVGSDRIDCDQPLHMVVLSGVFDRDSLFANGVALAGGSTEALAMRLVAEIYDPETDMPLGLIGDPSGASLNLFAGDSSLPGTGANQGGMMLDTSRAGQTGDLVPEAVCQ